MTAILKIKGKAGVVKAEFDIASKGSPVVNVFHADQFIGWIHCDQLNTTAWNIWLPDGKKQKLLSFKPEHEECISKFIENIKLERDYVQTEEVIYE